MPTHSYEEQRTLRGLLMLAKTMGFSWFAKASLVWSSNSRPAALLAEKQVERSPADHLVKVSDQDVYVHLDHSAVSHNDSVKSH